MDPLRTGAFYTRRPISLPPLRNIVTPPQGVARMVRALLPDNENNSFYRLTQPKEEVVLLSEASRFNVSDNGLDCAKAEPQIDGSVFMEPRKSTGSPAHAYQFPVAGRKRSRASLVFDQIVNSTPLAPAVLEDVARRDADYHAQRSPDRTQSASSGGDDGRATGLAKLPGVGDQYKREHQQNSVLDGQVGRGVDAFENEVPAGKQPGRPAGQIRSSFPQRYHRASKLNDGLDSRGDKSAEEAGTEGAKELSVSNVDCTELCPMSDQDDWNEVTRIIARRVRPKQDKGGQGKKDMPLAESALRISGVDERRTESIPVVPSLPAVAQAAVGSTLTPNTDSSRDQLVEEPRSNCSFCEESCKRMYNGPAGRNTLCGACYQRWRKFHARQKRRGAPVDPSYIPPRRGQSYGAGRCATGLETRTAVGVPSATRDERLLDISDAGSVHQPTDAHWDIARKAGTGAKSMLANCSSPENGSGPKEQLNAPGAPDPVSRVGAKGPDPPLNLVHGECLSREPPHLRSPRHTCSPPSRGALHSCPAVRSATEAEVCGTSHLVPSASPSSPAVLDGDFCIAASNVGSKKTSDPARSRNESSATAADLLSPNAHPHSEGSRPRNTGDTPRLSKPCKPVKRKGGRISEVLRLQKSMETAMWTESRQLQLLAEPILSVDDDEMSTVASRLKSSTGGSRQRRTMRLQSRSRNHSGPNTLPGERRTSRMVAGSVGRESDSKTISSPPIKEYIGVGDVGGSARKQATPTRLRPPMEIEDEAEVCAYGFPISKRRRVTNQGSSRSTLKQERPLHKFDRPVRRARS